VIGPKMRHRRGGKWTTHAALVILAAAVLAGTAAPVLAPHDPVAQQLTDAFSAPNTQYLLGTDHLGRDVLSRLVYGARSTLSSAVAVLGLALLLGMAIGVIAGSFGRWVDALLMRLTDLLLAFPTLLLAVAVVGTWGQSLFHVVVVLAAVSWAGFARTVRGLVLVCREQAYVLAARALGASPRHVVIKEILPNVIGPVVVLASVEFGSVILTIAGLNFLGLGVQPPAAEWGAMLRAAQPHLQTDPQLLLFPCRDPARRPQRQHARRLPTRRHRPDPPWMTRPDNRRPSTLPAFGRRLTAPCVGRRLASY
jgi:peptide/nickel transport system permease protein